MLTLQNIYDDVYAKTGLTTSDVATSTLLTFINQRYNDLTQIVTEVNEDFLLTSTTTSMTSGSRLFAMPSGLIKTKRIEVAYDTAAANWKKAEYFDLNVLGEATDDATIKRHFTTSEPAYDIAGTNWDLLPPATANVTNGFKAYYIAQPTALSAVGDSPNIFLQGFEHLLSDGAIIDIAQKLGLQQIAQDYSVKWEQGTKNFRRQSQNRALDENLSFKPINENRE